MPPDLGLLTLASVLRRGRQLDHLSSSITIIALAWGLLQWPMGFGTRIGSALATLLVLVGVLQKVWAMRVALDADLFEALGHGDALSSDDGLDRDNGPERGEAPGGGDAPGAGEHVTDRLTSRLAAMDAMLVGTGLMPARLAGRPLAPRTRGALRLLVVQAAIVGFQVALTVSSLLAMPWLFPAYG
ncbi:hypothetical protein [Pigmentiphaga litoralis]|uniref:hypothetical protein n=1 Tax=Pigmentiphaga litoralis TaxID=516702 RepID=UPI003B429795